MPRPQKYATEEERREAQRLQKRRSAIKGRRVARGLDPLAPHAGAIGTGAKLTAEQVAEIRRLRSAENWTLKTLARRFGVSQAAISEIVLRKSWNY